MDDSKKQEDNYLFILLGFDNLYSINLKELYLEKAKLEIVFSHLTHNYPLGMGLFVQGSKLHFFGGENLLDCDQDDQDNIDLDIGLKKKRPYIGEKSRLSHTMSIFEEITYFDRNSKEYTTEIRKLAKNWFNMKVFSFNITPVTPDTSNPQSFSIIGSHDFMAPFNINTNNRLCLTRDYSSRLPKHFGFKVRPIVVTLLNKLYVLTTQPYTAGWRNNPVLYGKQPFLFELFDPKKGEWTKLPNPPYQLNCLILGYGGTLEIYHCVYKNKLLLMTTVGNYLFDAIAERWKVIINLRYPPILASLEYGELLLAFVQLNFLSYQLVAYDLASFGMEKYYTSRVYLANLNIKANFRRVERASLCLVEDKRICLVCRSFCSLHIFLFEVIEKLDSLRADVKCKAVFDIPDLLLDDSSILRTFFFWQDIKADQKENARESNQGCSGVLESNSAIVRNLPSTIRTTSDVQTMICSMEFGGIKPSGVFLNLKQHIAFVEFEDGQSLNKAIKSSPIHISGDRVYIAKASDASESRRSWWRREIRKAMKGVK